jgi:glyceraldehyde-3-phosphate dehydrogenase (NAD(P))
MSRIRAAVVGYGVIGKRVADAVALQPDMELAGVGIRPGSPSLMIAQRLGYRVFLSGPDTLNTDGTLADLLPEVDVVLDCTPSGMPAENLPLYDWCPDLPVIVQGGEQHSFGGISFNAFANYRQALRQRRVRVISCSSTGCTRLLWRLHDVFGIEEAFLSLWRRGADPGKRSKTPINALSPTLGRSHHAPDVLTVLPGLNLYSMSCDCPTTLGHVLTLQADLARPATAADVLHAFCGTPRILVDEGLASTADLAEYFQDLGRPRRDRPEVYVWAEGVHATGRLLTISFSVHMESITIPETIDCVRAVLGRELDGWTSILTTDQSLGINKEPSCYPPQAS